jgi:tRNA(Ile)-lysidine synthase
VGLSGGVDSVVLLKLLSSLRSRLRFTLTAVHVNHGLSGNAPGWGAFCTALCKRWKIALTVERVAVQKGRHGIEAEARTSRYQAFSRCAADFMLLAHHLDDQTETLMLQLLRGAGVRGLAGMREVGRNAQLPVPVVRPLLAISRADILRYARRHRLSWIEDESNEEIALRRNFLRHRVFPEIEKKYPAYREALSRTAAHCGEAAAILEEVGVADADLQSDASHLDCGRLRKLPPARAANALRTFCSLHGLLAPDTARLGEMLRQLLGSQVDAGVKILHDGVELRRYRDAVWILRPRTESPGKALSWRGESVLELGDGAGIFTFGRRNGGAVDAVRISAEKLAQDDVSVRWRQGGEKIQPDAARPRRSLKNLLQEAAVPPWERTLPLLFCGGTLVWAPGIGVDCAFQAAARERAWFVSWRRLHYTRNEKFGAPRSG